uniref:Carboxylic ester hydrolase n=1 Tax=Plectus sambesii TaxID=2011161 RepID=A0A914VTP0_9BILA
MFTSWVALFVLASLLPQLGDCAATPYTVNIGSQATIVGYEYDSPASRQFLGIPYAQSISERNRFTPPLRRDPSGQMIAQHWGSSCWQPGDVNTANNAEDCLFLNIWTPKIQNITQQKYPVFFFIHGGGYQTGSGIMGMQNIISRDIVTVSINYRLNVFGFFTTRDSSIPGNMGLKDQIEALNWVKRYISYFGGDPNMITIAGHSAGSMSVSLLTLSPVSQNLFQRAIFHSGSGFSTGYFSNSINDNNYSKTVAVTLGCITADNWDKHDALQMQLMLRCLQTKTAQQIHDVGGFFIPLVDGPGGVIPDQLEVLAQRRPPIPIMIGNTHDEEFNWQLNTGDGGVLSNESVAYLSRFTRQYATNAIAHTSLIRYFNNSQSVEQAIKAAYIDSTNINDSDNIGWAKVQIQLYTELQFIGPTYRDAMLARQTHSPVYLYSFDYLAPWAWPTLDPRLRDSAIPHGWELQYIYYSPNGGHGTSDDLATQNYMETFWTNFIKYGNPTPTGSAITWPQLAGNMEFMSIGPHPTASTGFHPKSKFFACNVPAIEGVSHSWCT